MTLAKQAVVTLAGKQVVTFAKQEGSATREART
jgi:hypothetical protein